MQTVSPTQLGGDTMPPCSDWPFCAPPHYLYISLCLPLSLPLGGFNQSHKTKKKTNSAQNVLSPSSPMMKKEWGEEGREIKADVLTHKRNINQLPGNRIKGTEGRRRGIKARSTFSEMQEQEKGACVRSSRVCASWDLLSAWSGLDTGGGG